MSYRQIAFFGSILVGAPQYNVILYDIIRNDVTMQTKLKNITDSYNFKDNVPKDYVFVKLASGISDSRREFIANGIRAFFKDDFTVLVDRTVLLSSINSAIFLF